MTYNVWELELLLWCYFS